MSGHSDETLTLTLTLTPPQEKSLDQRSPGQQGKQTPPLMQTMQSPDFVKREGMRALIPIDASNCCYAAAPCGLVKDRRKCKPMGVLTVDGMVEMVLQEAPEAAIAGGRIYSSIHGDGGGDDCRDRVLRLSDDDDDDEDEADDEADDDADDANDGDPRVMLLPTPAVASVEWMLEGKGKEEIGMAGRDARCSSSSCSLGNVGAALDLMGNVRADLGIINNNNINNINNNNNNNNININNINNNIIINNIIINNNNNNNSDGGSSPCFKSAEFNDLCRMSFPRMSPPQLESLPTSSPSPSPSSSPPILRASSSSPMSSPQQEPASSAGDEAEQIAAKGKDVAKTAWHAPSSPTAASLSRTSISVSGYDWSASSSSSSSSQGTMMVHSSSSLARADASDPVNRPRRSIAFSARFGDMGASCFQSTVAQHKLLLSNVVVDDDDDDDDGDANGDDDDDDDDDDGRDTDSTADEYEPCGGFSDDDDDNASCPPQLLLPLPDEMNHRQAAERSPPFEHSVMKSFNDRKHVAKLHYDACDDNGDGDAVSNGDGGGKSAWGGCLPEEVSISISGPLSSSSFLSSQEHDLGGKTPLCQAGQMLVCFRGEGENVHKGGLNQNQNQNQKLKLTKKKTKKKNPLRIAAELYEQGDDRCADISSRIAMARFLCNITATYLDDIASSLVTARGVGDGSMGTDRIDSELMELNGLRNEHFSVLAGTRKIAECCSLLQGLALGTSKSRPDGGLLLPECQASSPSAETGS